MSLTSGLFNPKSRFGFHKEQLLQQDPNYSDKTKAVCYIPTRMEVFQQPISELKNTICNWFNNAPEALRPSNAQKQAVITLLKKRVDAKKISAHIAELEAL